MTEYSEGVEFQARCLGKVRSWNRRARSPWTRSPSSADLPLDYCRRVRS
ncbi:hypothetical protein [Streptomyces sp. NPDC056660]